MIKQIEIKSELLNETLEIIIIKYKKYYKVIIRGKDSKVKMEKKYLDFDELLVQFIEQSIEVAYLETKLEELAKKMSQ